MVAETDEKVLEPEAKGDQAEGTETTQKFEPAEEQIREWFNKQSHEVLKQHPGYNLWRQRDNVARQKVFEQERVEREQLKAGLAQWEGYIAGLPSEEHRNFARQDLRYVTLRERAYGGREQWAKAAVGSFRDTIERIGELGGIDIDAVLAKERPGIASEDVVGHVLADIVGEARKRDQKRMNEEIKKMREGIKKELLAELHRGSEEPNSPSADAVPASSKEGLTKDELANIRFSKDPHQATKQVNEILDRFYGQKRR